MAGVALAALQDFRSFMDGLVIDLRLGGPPAGEVRELIAFAGREIPRGGLSAIEGQRRGRAVVDGGAAADDAVGGVDAIVQGDFDGVADIFKGDIEVVLLDTVRRVFEDEVAVAVRRGKF